MNAANGGVGHVCVSPLALCRRFAGFNTDNSSSTMTQPTDEFKKPDPSQAQDDRPTPFDSPSLRLVPRLEGVVVTLCRVQHRMDIGYCRGLACQARVLPQTGRETEEGLSVIASSFARRSAFQCINRRPDGQKHFMVPQGGVALRTP